MAGDRFSVRSSAIGCLLIAALLLGGCRSLPEPDQDVVRAAELEAFYQQWRGTEYQYGGTSSRGVDCSALTMAAYDDLYGIRLPRTTEDQSELGSRVRFRNLRAGDLVFFKTGIFDRHVGIYIGDGVFVHSSASSGVIKSSLKYGYWNDKYWKARRILD